MNILLWILQILLALHTAMGAIWKFSNSEQSVSSLSAIPHEVWLGIAVFELLCSVGLILPALNKRFARAVPIAAAGIAVEMLLFTGVHLSSGSTEHHHVIYWLVVAALCVFVAYGRRVRK